MSLSYLLSQVSSSIDTEVELLQVSVYILFGLRLTFRFRFKITARCVLCIPQQAALYDVRMDTFLQMKPLGHAVEYRVC